MSKWVYLSAGFVAGYVTVTGLGYLSIRRASRGFLG
jgi:hypothetical protein